jgi:hypothetical protein
MKWEAARRYMCSALVEEALVGHPGLHHLTSTNLHQLYKLMPDKPSNTEPYARPTGPLVGSMRECVDQFVAKVEAADAALNRQGVMDELVNEQCHRGTCRKRAQVCGAGSCC